jgi:hypothetical protein
MDRGHMSGTEKLLRGSQIFMCWARRVRLKKLLQWDVFDVRREDAGRCGASGRRKISVCLCYENGWK